MNELLAFARRAEVPALPSWEGLIAVFGGPSRGVELFLVRRGFILDRRWWPTGKVDVKALGAEWKGCLSWPLPERWGPALDLLARWWMDPEPGARTRELNAGEDLTSALKGLFWEGRGRPAP